MKNKGSGIRGQGSGVEDESALDAAPATSDSELFEKVYEDVRAWCRARGYAGHDPFDALNSKIFQATPLRRSRLARLAWTQAFKRSPVNPRSLARVPAGKNPKGTALFALAELSRLRATRGEERLSETRQRVSAARRHARVAQERTRETQEHEREARALLDDLLAAHVRTQHGAAWGYNFDWQGRAFYAPRGTPAVVPTAFAVRALVEGAFALGAAAEVKPDAARIKENHYASEAKDEARASGRVADTFGPDAGAGKYLDAARAACEFVLRDLNRADETGDEVCFSYTPLDRTRVFNASLLAAEALASVGAATREPELIDYALRAARYVVRRQRQDGSWAYGADSYQTWADNFHTAFVLTSLARILRACDRELERDAATREEFRRALARGYEFWRGHFFLADGWPKYYHSSSHPADAHSAGAAIVALAELKEFGPDAPALAARVARWAVRELFDRRGFFYYQKRRLYTVRTPYMRWSQAWMMYALARLLEVMNAE
jgi:hypothetical protein